MKPAQDHGHIRALDGIRGFALLMVFAYHGLWGTIGTYSKSGRFAHKVVITGWVGVDLFFVLSGFLITTILLDAKAADNYFKVFYIRRSLRIFPLYYLVTAYAIFMYPDHISSRTQFFFWLNLSNLPTAFHPLVIGSLAHLWSLAIEEQFYVIWPSIVRWLRARTLAYVCIGVIVTTFLLRNLPPVLTLNQRWPELIYRLTPFRVDTLCAGALLAILAQNWPSLSEYRPHLRILCVTTGCIFLLTGFGRPYYAPSVARFGLTSLVLCFGSLVALALYPDGLTARLFSNGLLRKTGKYSYCFYLIHPFLVNPLQAHQVGIDNHLRSHGLHIPHNLVAVIVFALEYAVIMGICALSWQFFEGPIMRLKRHFRYHPVPEHLLA